MTRDNRDAIGTYKVEGDGYAAYDAKGRTWPVTDAVAKAIDARASSKKQGAGQ